MFNENILKNDERAIFSLRSLYQSNGYSLFRMSKFEEYDLYMQNKDFLASQGIITFNDTNGRLLALKPDVTLSIIKNFSGNATAKVYYNENVYRVSDSTHTYKEIMQTGLECIGDITDIQTNEVILLALESLRLLSDSFVLSLSHIGLVSALFDGLSIKDDMRREVTEAAASRNFGRLRDICSDTQYETLQKLLCTADTGIKLAELETLSDDPGYRDALNELRSVCNAIEKAGFAENINIDFSVSGGTGYYSSVVFKGYISGISTHVLSGGRYDTLMKKMGKTGGAIGFAVYLDALERLDGSAACVKPDALPIVNIALPKGRLGEKVYSMFERAGFDCPSIRETNRKLIFVNGEKRLNFFWVKPSDVAIYVERGVADIGVAGSDILLEYTPDVYELLDLNIGKCRMAVAAKNDFSDDTGRLLRVATKFPNIARSYYAEKCREIDIIHLNGSIEIAPLLDLSDVIVDIVETGKTLLENNLRPYETITRISARLIANKSSYRFKTDRINQIKSAMENEVPND